MLRITALLAVAATALALVASIGAAPAAVKLSGSVGPGETIVLKKGAARVKTLKAGRYTIVVRDRSSPRPAPSRSR